MVGNHRDAWGFGAIDPSSGTAQMLEVARILGKKLKNGTYELNFSPPKGEKSCNPGIYYSVTDLKLWSLNLQIRAI